MRELRERDVIPDELTQLANNIQPLINFVRNRLEREIYNIRLRTLYVKIRGRFHGYSVSLQGPEMERQSVRRYILIDLHEYLLHIEPELERTMAPEQVID